MPTKAEDGQSEDHVVHEPVSEGAGPTPADDFETLVAHAPICIHEIDLEGRLLSMNPAGLEMIQMDLEQIRGVDYLDFVSRNERAHVGRLLDEARHQGWSSQFEFSVEVDGDSRRFASMLVPVRGADGRIRRLMGMTEDITERFETNAQLEASEARFRDFAESAADFFWEVDATTRLTCTIGRFESITGLPPESAIGTSIVELWSDRETSELHPDIQAAFQEKRPFNDVQVRWPRMAGRDLTMSISGKPVHDAYGGFVGFRGSARDVTDLHTLSSRLAFQASHDELTGLANRREFERRLGELLSAARESGRPTEGHILCFLDLDQFKVINDTCGHVAGDELLRQLAVVLRSHVRSTDVLARLGGDEFAILMYGCEVAQAKRLLHEILESLGAMRFEWDDRIFSIGASFGVVEINDATRSVNSLFRAADTACYAAKDQGRNRIVVFRPGDEQVSRHQEQVRSVSRINAAFEDDRFRLHAQPIVPSDSDVADATRFEVLVRMEDVDGRVVGPGEFLAAAERYGLMNRLDLWVVETVLERLSRDDAAAVQLCAINLSGSSLGEEDFLDQVTAALDTTRVDPKTICFEITETAAITNLVHADRFIATLRARGCRFALDDFGSGMASFAYLKNLAVDYLKIDGTFVRDILADPVDFALVRSITEIGKEMGKTIIAEWVENEEILERLRTLDIDYVQGYVFGRPVPLDELLATAQVQ